MIIYNNVDSNSYAKVVTISRSWEVGLGNMHFTHCSRIKYRRYSEEKILIMMPQNAYEQLFVSMEATSKTLLGTITTIINYDFSFTQQIDLQLNLNDK